MECKKYHYLLDDIIDTSQNPVRLGDAAGNIGALAWDSREKKLAVSDIQTGALFFWDEQQGFLRARETYGKFSCMQYDYSCGRLTGFDTQSAAITRYYMKGNTLDKKILYDKLTKPAALVNHSSGMLFASTPEGIMMLSHDGHFQATKIDARVSVPLDPNAMCLSADEESLLIANAATNTLAMVIIDKDARLGAYLTFAFEGEFPNGLPSSIAVDANGFVYCAARSGIHLFDRFGLRIAVMNAGKEVSAICCGGKDNKLLFVAAGKTVYSLKLK